MERLTRYAILILFLSLFALVSCPGAKLGTDPSGDDLSGQNVINQDNYDPSSISDTAIASAAALKVYFEHASVGANVCSGIDALATSSPRYTSGRVSWASSHGTGVWVSGYVPGWYDSHSGLGDNHRGNPGADLKRSYFAESMASSLADKVDVAMFKFCYIDSPSDAASLFASVKTTMEALETAHPKIAFVWWTMPIQTSSDEQRQIYNDSVRSYCSKNGKRLFDIAALESHDDAGKAILDGSSRELLYSGYSSDGGHLNSSGELKMAKAYWKLLAAIAASK
jgi:hypothetical protein